MLLTPEERKHVKGILINKFRGDIRLFESGVKMLEELCGIPVSSHNLRELEDVCDHVGILNRGQVLLERSLSEDVYKRQPLTSRA